MRVHLSNSAYGVLDYMAQPVMMLLSAPILLHHMGVAAYGVWIIASAAVGAGSAVSSGFGDAVIQRVATLRATGDLAAIRRVVANMLTINLVLSGSLAILLWTLIPFITSRVTHFDSSLRYSCFWSLRIGSALIVLKSLESVFISAQRAYERYAPAVLIGIATRVLTILVSVWLAMHGFGIPALMLGAVVLLAAGTVFQWAALRGRLGEDLLRPAFHKETFRELSSFGGFSWLQAVSGVLFSQADRLLLGMTLGASAVSYYGVCVQMAQPIHGLTAAGLHFLFPHLALRFATGSVSAVRRPVFAALLLNVLSAVSLTAGLIWVGPRLLALWMGQAFADHTAGLLPLLALGFGLLALNVTGHYTILALGKIRIVTGLNVAGGVCMLTVMALAVQKHGVHGAAWARLVYGPITCLLYVPLLLRLRKVAPEYAGGVPQVVGGEA